MAGWNIGSLGFAPKSWNKKGNEFFFGKDEQNYQQSTLGKDQEPLKQQLINAGMQGQGGAFGQAGNYYGGLLSNDSQDFDAMAAPELRRFNEQIVPDLAEQFAGMGSGALSSSGFRNSAIGAGTDLSERLGALRANLRSQGAQGLMNLGQQGLGSFNENIHRPATGGLFEAAANGAGRAAGAYAGGGF